MRTMRQPFWLPASSFYFLVSGFAAASFFLVIGILQTDGREPEIVIGGLVASSVLVTGVVIRELVLRNARERFDAERKRLDSNLESVSLPVAGSALRKLTLEQNSAAIERIRSKSEAAMVFERVADGHREVFELCAEYRRIVAGELRSIHPSSPRLKALIQGNEYALKTHKFHILRWAELESRSLAATAKQSVDESSRVKYIEQARRPLELALQHYPDENALKDSLEVLDELVFTVRVRELMEEAAEAAAGGDHGLSREIYKQALRFLETQERSEVHAVLRVQIMEALANYEDQ